MNGSHVCVCVTLPQALFFRKNDVPGIFMPCVCVLRCRRRFFFRKNDVPGIFETCNSPVEVFLRAAGVFFFLANSDSQMALAIFVM